MLLRSFPGGAATARRGPALVALVSLLLTALATPAAGANPPGAPGVADAPARVLVELAAPAVAPRAGRGVDAAAARLTAVRERVMAQLPEAARAHARSLERLPFVTGRFDTETRALLASDPEVVAVHEDRVFYPLLQETLPLVGADLVHDEGFEGTGQAVAVLDTGVDAGHPLLQGSVVAEACFSASTHCPNGQDVQVGPGAGTFCDFADGCFHGTHVAGIAVGRPAGGRRGVAPAADLVSIQVFSRATGSTCSGQGEDPCTLAYTSDILAGMDHVLALADTLEIAAVNLSLGGGGWSSPGTCDAQNAPLRIAAESLAEAGILTLASSGNDGFTNALASPACVSSVVSVGATRDDDGVWSGSNDAAFLDLLAPGTDVVSGVPFALLGFSWGSATGTSMAAPHASGALALLREVVPELPLAAGLEALRSTGTAVTDGRTGRTHPRLDVADAVARLRGPKCDNLIDDDGDGTIDWDGGPAGEPADPQCVVALGDREGSRRCGLGFELAPVLVGLAALRRARADVGQRLRVRPATRRHARCERAASSREAPAASPGGPPERADSPRLG